MRRRTVVLSFVTASALPATRGEDSEFSFSSRLVALFGKSFSSSVVIDSRGVALRLSLGKMLLDPRVETGLPTGRVEEEWAVQFYLRPLLLDQDHAAVAARLDSLRLKGRSKADIAKMPFLPIAEFSIDNYAWTTQFVPYQIVDGKRRREVSEVKERLSAHCRMLGKVRCNDYFDTVIGPT